MPTNVISVDLEDWFHILDLDSGYGPEEWSHLPSRVERNSERLLDLFDRHSVRATWFTLGWVADRFPGLLKRIVERGHEVASHGFHHQLVYEQTPVQFQNDITASIAAIESACGIRPTAYRAPGFSVTQQALWAFETLGALGITVDSSVFPAPRGHGGLPSAPSFPFRIVLPDGSEILEFPITTTTLFGRRLAYCGGGYLRLFPTNWVARRIGAANRCGQPVIVYIHPRDIDPKQPRMSMSPTRRFKSYVGLSTCISKLDTLLRQFPFGTLADALSELERSELPIYRLMRDTDNWKLFRRNP